MTRIFVKNGAGTTLVVNSSTARAVVAEEVDKIAAGSRKLGLSKSRAAQAAQEFGTTAPTYHKGPSRFNVPRHYK